MSNSSFPRGVFDPQQSTPIATARWAFSHELSAYQMRENAIWLGAEPRPHADVRPAIEALSAFRAETQTYPRLASTYKAHLSEQIDTHLYGVRVGADVIMLGEAAGCTIPNGWQQTSPNLTS